jgi:ubiquinone/menaquinone biosynthesis C-methylase UbiE
MRLEPGELEEKVVCLAVCGLCLPDNTAMTVSTNPDWNNVDREHASQKWRRQSAAMGSDVTRAIVEAAQVTPDMRVLDIACGTGEPAISLAALLVRGEIIGVDISPAPLKIARERAAERKLANARFQQADVHDLPFANGSFDSITSRLGVMYFADLPRALKEMHRVLKPGGRATLLAWGPMDQPYFETTVGTLLRTLPGAVVPEAGSKVFAFGTEGVLSRSLREGGFFSATEQLVTVPLVWPGRPEEVWEYFRDVAVPFVPLLESIPPERQKEVDAAVVQAISQYYDGANINFTATVNITIAVK